MSFVVSYSWIERERERSRGACHVVSTQFLPYWTADLVATMVCLFVYARACVCVFVTVLIGETADSIKTNIGCEAIHTLIFFDWGVMQEISSFLKNDETSIVCERGRPR